MTADALPDGVRDSAGAVARTRLCARIDDADIDQAVSLCGWVLSRRDHGGVIFIDLRDRSGRVQVVADPDTPQAFAVADSVRNEYVLQVQGRVRRRPPGTLNPDLPTGGLEVIAAQITLLNASVALPFQLDDTEISEEVRLKYRFLDLRREPMQRNLRLRHQLSSALREFLHAHEFIEIETPVLTRSTPEGARDYLVPSRTRPGEFFALPQSPQLFKQLLMVSGFERYYQIARCFRDEDLRADRQPEFTQLDLEMSFVDEADVIGLMDRMLAAVFERVLGVALPLPLPQMDFTRALAEYGTDRPDLRIPLKLTELTDVMGAVEFNVFSAPANDPEGRVAALYVPDGGDLTRAQIDRYTEFVAQYGAGGLAYIKVNDPLAGRAGLQSPILKFLPDAVLQTILTRTGAQANGLIFFGADRADIVNPALAALRLRIGEDRHLIDGDWRPIWIVDFPLLEWNREAQRWHSVHHPFTAPRTEDIALLESDPGAVRSRAYDLVLNGAEVGGGSIRICQSDLQQQVLQVLGIDAQQAQARFGFLLQALQYGAPPHGGIAFGLDRLAAMLSAVESIRDVIAFPKTQKAACLLTDAPNQVDAQQLKGLGLRLR